MKCKRCGGSGDEPDNASIAKQMRERRKKAGVTQRDVASEMGIRAPYLCDLELGKRNWSPDLRERFLRAL